MGEVVPGPVPGRPWLDWKPTETFDEYVNRVARTCGMCGHESESDADRSHACTAPEIDEIVTFEEGVINADLSIRPTLSVRPIAQIDEV
jgi:hypothetical protein